MRPLLILLIVIGQTGCLLAPPRPGGSNGDDDGDCLPADAKLGLSIAAALDSPDRDTLIRAGHIGDDWYLYFYPSTAKTSLCPDRTFQLTGDGIVSIDAIEPAVVIGTTLDLLVLASFANGDSAVIDVRSDGSTLSEAGRVVAEKYHPIPINTPSGPAATGFIALRANDQIWFGGGQQDIAVASIAGVMTKLSGTATVLGKFSVIEGWYHAVAVRYPDAEKNFALIGSGSSYAAVARVDFIDTANAGDHDLCSSPPDCHGRLAFTVSSPGPVDPAEAFSIDRTSGELETIASRAIGTPAFDIKSHVTMDRGPGSVLDAASGALFGDNKTDVAMLWGSGTMHELIVYDAMLTAPTTNSVSRLPFDANLDRVELLRTDGAPRILLLSDDPRGDPERCLQMNGATLEDCP